MNRKNYLQRVLNKCGLTILERPRDPFTDMSQLLSSHSIHGIIDGGAYHGSVSKLFSSFFPNAIIYAFEPLKESFVILEQNVKDSSAIRPVNLGLSSTSGKRTLYVTEQLYCSSLAPRNVCGEKYYPEATRPHHTENIEVVTIDEWTRSQGIKDIDIIKLDVQGHELEALKGAQNILQRSNVKLICTEIEFVELYKNNCLFFEVEGFLRNYAFQLYHLYDLQSGEADGQLIYGDAIFIRRAKGERAVM